MRDLTLKSYKLVAGYTQVLLHVNLVMNSHPHSYSGYLPNREQFCHTFDPWASDFIRSYRARYALHMLHSHNL